LSVTRFFQLLIVAAALVLAGGPALAGGGSAKPSKGHGEGAANGPADLSLKMPRLVAPVMVKGEMVRYMHLDVTLQLPDVKNRNFLMEKVPYMQDAFVRSVHATSILRNEETQEVDVDGLRSRLLAICERVAGAGLVKDIEFRDVSKSME
jgi:flagellar basal body-associated protein FliL